MIVVSHIQHIGCQPKITTFLVFITLMADGPYRPRLPIPPSERYLPACGHQRSSHIDFFIAMQVHSALLQLVSQWLNFTYSRFLFLQLRNELYLVLVFTRIEVTSSAILGVRVYLLYQTTRATRFNTMANLARGLKRKNRTKNKVWKHHPTLLVLIVRRK